MWKCCCTKLRQKDVTISVPVSLQLLLKGGDNHYEKNQKYITFKGAKYTGKVFIDKGSLFLVCYD